MTNCPNCGAPITGWRCAYCETVFDISAKDRLVTGNSLLKAKTKYLHDVTTMKDLYESAIQAMWSFALTPNEARKMCGLEEIKRDLHELKRS